MEINYSSDLLERDSTGREHIVGVLRKIQEEYHVSQCNILEVGCGFGQNMKVFVKDNNVIGMDGLDEAVVEAHKNGLNVVQVDLNDGIPADDASLDWVLCLDVLEHLMRPDKLMMEMYRVLRNEGHCIVNVPNHFDYRGRLRLLLGGTLDTHDFFPGLSEWENPHVRFFTHKGILGLVDCVGFKVIQNLSHSFISFPKLHWFERLFLRRFVDMVAAYSPDLFTHGFFLVLKK